MIIPVKMLNKIYFLESIFFNNIEKIKIERDIPKLTRVTGQQTVHQIKAIGFKRYNTDAHFPIDLFLKVKYKNRGMNKSKIIFNKTIEVYFIPAILKKRPNKTMYGIKNGNNPT